MPGRRVLDAEWLAAIDSRGGSRETLADAELGPIKGGSRVGVGGWFREGKMSPIDWSYDGGSSGRRGGSMPGSWEGGAGNDGWP
jgi:hypothetical protein